MPHLERWLFGFQASDEATRLRELSNAVRWNRHPEATLAVATAIYGRLPDGAKLWIERGTFVDADPRTLSLVLGTSLNSDGH
mgnify:FL=1